MNDMAATRRYQTLKAGTHGRIAYVTLNRPEKRNALDPLMLDEIVDLLGALSRNTQLNAVIITGAGRTFSTGVDLNTPFFMEHVTDNSVFAGTRLLNTQHRVIERIYELPQITIAGINGDAVGGGGFGIAMACDLRVAVRSARFWMIPAELDVVQDFGLSWLLQRQIGPSRTLRMALLGEPVTAETGERWGFVDVLVDEQSALDQFLGAFTQRLDDIGTDALRMLKLIIRNGAHSPLREQLGIEAVANGLTFQSKEFNKKKESFLERLRRNEGA